MKHRICRSAAATWVVVSLLLALEPAAVQAQCGEWQWQNPLPQGNTLRGVWGSSGSDVFAVGRDGIVHHHRHRVAPATPPPPAPASPPASRRS
jgi:hypothetical protein